MLYASCHGLKIRSLSRCLTIVLELITVRVHGVMNDIAGVMVESIVQ